VVKISDLFYGKCASDDYVTYGKWILSNVTSPQPTSPPSSQEDGGLLDGYVNIGKYTNGSCSTVSDIKSTKLGECDYDQRTTATSSVITITDGCLKGTQRTTVSYKAGVCNPVYNCTYSITPKITSDLTVPRVTSRSVYYNQYRDEYFH
jgi:hypothetical protein